MADFYVSATAGGGGVGSEADPFTIVEAFAKATYGIKDTVWILAGTYTVTANLATADDYVLFTGYNTTIGDLDEVWGEGSGATAKPVIQAQAAAGVTKVVDINHYDIISNVVISGENASTCELEGGVAFNCVARNGVVGIAVSYCYHCIAYGNSGVGISGQASYCLSRNNGSHGFSGYGVSCVAYQNTGAGFSALGGNYVGCTATGNTSHGFNISRGNVCINCIAEDNGGWGYTSGGLLNIIDCNAWNNTSGTYNTTYVNAYNLSTADPALVNPAGGDFSLGNANLYGLGAYVGSLDGTGMLDLGAIQKSPGAGTAAVAPTFAGITGLERISPGELKVSWAAGTGDITGYKIFVRAGSAPTFADDTYLWGVVDNTRTSVIINTTQDNDTLLDGSASIYVGVRACNDINNAEDANTVTLNLTPMGGKTPWSFPDTVVAI